MIENAIVLLKDDLQAYINTKDASATVIVDNIAMFDTSNGDALTNNIVLTLVNIEEESTLKNQALTRRPIGTGTIDENTPLYLNLYVLFTCNYSGNEYRLALRRLSYIIQFFQSKTSFSTTLSAGAGVADIENGETVNLRFTLELYTLTFEQVNHLWGSLGGRQMPFAMYKLKLVATTERAKLRDAPAIKEIDINL